MEKMIRNVGDITREDRQALEHLTGKPLKDKQQVFIMTFTPAMPPSAEARRQAMEGLEKTWTAVDRHMQEQGITPEEFDAAADEAIKRIRRRKD